METTYVCEVSPQFLRNLVEYGPVEAGRGKTDRSASFVLLPIPSTLQPTLILARIAFPWRWITFSMFSITR
jgi:hypothetical protein